MKKLQVRDLMTTEVVTASPEDSVARVRNLMYEHWVRHIPVVDGKKRLVGLVTYRDLLRRHLIEQSDRPVWVEQEELERIETDTVTQHIVDQVTADTDLAEAGRLLLDTKKGCLPVVDEDGRLAGMLSEADFVRYLVAER
ncbi:MAG: CBS domain-containing protein [bacterium]|nr:CBS domain-containing protein [bacterium]